MIVIDNEKKVTKQVKEDDLVLLYNDESLIGINFYNFSSLCKIKSEGRIVLPSDILIDIINDRLNLLNIEKLEYVKETGFKIGKILSVEEHPSSSKLHCLKVDIGDEVLDIVCGAINVKINMYVVVATIGTMMNDGTLIKQTNILGKESNGMCCSPKELGLNIEYPEHSLLEIEEDVSLGQDFFALQGK